ncbi:MAG TPA: TIGR03118 family protein [Saprospiraceae bacterium]|nr:TIGR03118 family protein [Saprospiraceae bacterium]
MDESAVNRSREFESQKSGIRHLIPFLYTLFFFMLFTIGCMKDEDVLNLNEPNDKEKYDASHEGIVKIKSHYEMTNLVSDVEEYNPEIIDPNLVNAWGIAISPTGVFWISAAETELSVVYNDEGETLRPPVTMDGEPTGQVFNPTTGFRIPMVGAARFIFVTEDGKITAWRSGNVAATMEDESDEGASYTGAELAMNGSQALLYVANVAGGEIAVYDTSWAELEGFEFEDPNLPAGASPFNIQLVYGNLYVTYVGPGGGLVNVFTTGGDFVKRFATGGTLSAPWGITNTPPEFGLGQSILVGNFGDGKINIYNKNGQFKGQLGDEDGPFVIDGLWALEFTPAAFAGTGEVDLYFTAGPDNEEHGIFGEIEFTAEEEE